MINVEINNIQIPNQPPELFYGNKEYKERLDFDTNIKKHLINKVLNKKASQMRYRLIEGDGKAIYLIGIKDNGDACGISLAILLQRIYFFIKIVKIIDANIKIIRIYRGYSGNICSIRVFLNQKDIDDLICF